MKKLGKIKNISGYLNTKSASIIFEDDAYYLVDDNSFQDNRINLSEHLAQVQFDSDVVDSISRIGARSVLGGIAGSSWGKGHTGVAGAIAGFGTSINTTKEISYVRLLLNDGVTTLHGETNTKTISLLRSISPEYTPQDLLKIEEQNEKLERFLDDASNTYYEVKNEIDQLKKQIPLLKKKSKDAPNFEQRDQAKQEIETTQNKIEHKKELLKELEFRAKAIKAFGSFDKFNDAQAPLAKEIISLQDKLNPKPINKKIHYAFAFCVVSFLAFATEEHPTVDDIETKETIFNICLLFLTYYISRFLIRVTRKKPRLEKLEILQKEYDKKYGLNNIEL